MNQVTEKERTQVGGLGWGGGGGATLEYRKVSEERGYYN